MRRALLGLALLAACSSPPPKPAPIVRIDAAPDAGSAPAPLTSVEAPAAVADLWRASLEGDVASVRAAAPRIVAALVTGDAKPYVGRVGGLSSWLDGRTSVVTWRQHQLFVLDAKTHEVRGAALAEGVTDVAPVPSTTLFIASVPAGIRVHDARGAKLLKELAYTAYAAAEDGTAIALLARREPEAPDEVALYDVATNQVRWHAESPRPLDVLRKTGGAHELDFADGASIVVARGPFPWTGPVAAFDAATGRRLASAAPLHFGDLGWTYDRAFVAYVDRDEPRRVRVDRRADGTSEGTTTACPDPSAVTIGKWLVVGGRNRFCVLEVPSMHLVASVVLPEPVRGDDAEVVPTMFGSELVHLARRDGLQAIVHLPDGARRWTSKDAALVRVAGSVRVVDFAGDYTMQSFPPRNILKSKLDPGERERYFDLARGRKTWRLGLGESSDLVACEIGDWILPREACEPARSQ